jgi:hypothetical protein
MVLLRSRNSAINTVSLSRMRSRLHHLRYLSIIIVAPLLLFWRWLVLGEVLYWGTILLQFWPWRRLVQDSLLAGQWPLWNALLGNGTPLLANHQSAVFYPLNWLQLWAPVEQGLTFSVVLHLVIAGGGMYLFGLYLGLKPFSATVAALSYMFSGYIVGRTQFVVMVNAAAWFPYLLLLGDRLARRRTVTSAIGLGVALALQLLAGHAQLWFYALLLLGAYVLYRSRQESGTLKGMARAGLLLGGAVVVAVLLSAVQILPTAEFVTQSPRSSGAERYEALTYSFWPWRFITLVAPDFFGSPAQGNYWGYATYWEDHAYVGMLPTVLALAGLGYFLAGQLTTAPPTVASDKPLAVRVVPFFGWCIPVSLLLALGWNTPVYLWLFDYVPGFGFFRAPARLLIWYTLSMAVLAGVGAQYVATDGRIKRYWLRLMVVALAIFLGAAVGTLLVSGNSVTFLPATRRAGLLLALAIGILLLRPGPAAGGRLTPVRWEMLVVSFIVVDLLLAAYPLIPTAPARLFYTPSSTATRLKSTEPFPRYFVDTEFAYQTTFNGFFRLSDFGPADETGWQVLKDTLIPNLGVSDQIPSTNNNDPLVVSHWQMLVTQPGQRGSEVTQRILAIMGTHYHLTTPTSNAQAVDYAPVAGALPRAYFASGVRATASTDEALTLLMSPDFDYRHEVIIIGAGESRQPLPASSDVVVTQSGHEEIQLTASSDTPGYVVLTDTYYPGWVATVDGIPVPISPVNVAFRAVPVTAGEHNIVFRYQPTSFYSGLIITLVTTILIILTGLYGLFAGWSRARARQ